MTWMDYDMNWVDHNANRKFNSAGLGRYFLLCQVFINWHIFVLATEESHQTSVQVQAKEGLQKIKMVTKPKDYEWTKCIKETRCILHLHPRLNCHQLKCVMKESVFVKSTDVEMKLEVNQWGELVSYIDVIVIVISIALLH